MRKIVSIIAALCIVATALFAVSYTNNTYHKLAEEYTEKAQKAMDAGYYELAEEYAAEAKRNAALSEAFIAMMLARTEAEEAIQNARAIIDGALEKGVDPNSKEYNDALASLNKAQTEFEDEKYPESKLDAEKVKDILSDDYIAAVAAENEAKNAAKDAIAKAKEALDAAEEAGVPADSDAYKAAKDYYDQAQKDFDDGKYDSAKENADKAVEAISGDEVKKILDKKAAEEALENAKKAIEDAKAAGISEDDPLYKKALEDYDKAVDEFEKGDYAQAKEDADKVVDALKPENVEAAKNRKAASDAIDAAAKRIEEAKAAGMNPDEEPLKGALSYYEQAVKDFDDGKYPEAKDNADKVLEILSEDAVKEAAEANAKKPAEEAKAAIEKAKERLDYAKSADLDETNGDAYKAALDYYNQALADYDDGKYPEAKDNAEQVLALLPLDEIDGIVNAKKAAADEALAKAKAALDYAKEIGLDPRNEDFQDAVELYNSAKDAYDAGNYDKAKADADKVAELLDPAAVAKMKAKADAEAAISKARERIIAAKAAGLDTGYDPFRDALEYYKNAQKDFENEDYASAKENAEKVSDLLSDDAIDEMLEKAEADRAKSAAEGALAAAKERIDYAEAAGLDVSDSKFKAALDYYNRALDELSEGKYQECTDDANEVLNILDDAYINNLLARGDAEKAIAAAQERIKYAESINAPRDFPIAYEAAKAYYSQALDDYTAEQYEKAIADANKVIDALADIHEMTVLPKYYIVRPWAESKDCFWNISGRSYVYNNPWLWENLYEANKDNIPERNNPNLILPGMKMEIPSISGEYRDGVYSPDVEYGTFSTNR